MIKKHKRISSILLAFIIVMMTGLMAFAYDGLDFEWSAAKTFSLSSGSGFTTKTTSTKLSYYKDSPQEVFYLNTISKTMWTYPAFRAVNSSNTVVSDLTNTPNAGEWNGYSSIWGDPDHTYYGSLKPAFNQLGTDTIKIRMDLQ